MSLLKESQSGVRHADMKDSEKGLSKVIRDHVLLLVSSLGVVKLTEFKSIYKKLYGNSYTCPVGIAHGLQKCLKEHFAELSIFGTKDMKKTSLRKQASLETAADNGEPANEQVNIILI